jgi:hypothetical protein
MSTVTLEEAQKPYPNCLHCLHGSNQTMNSSSPTTESRWPK